MKKQWTVAVLIFAFLLTMAGCSLVDTVRKLEAAEEAVEDRVDAAEEMMEDRIREMVVPQPVPESVPEPSSAAEAPAQTAAQLLTKEQAQQIALEYLNVTADQVQWMRTEYEIDDGVPQFDVEFHQGDWEYEFEIHGESGRILSFDKDYR